MNTRENTHDELLNQCLTFLESNGVTVDEVSRRVIKFFFSTESHVSLHDIEEQLRRDGYQVNVAAVRRIMRLLVDYGFVSEKQFPDGRTRYEHVHLGEHHDHLYCLRCGKIIEFCSPQMEQLQLKVAQEHGFHAFAHRMQIHGLCTQCYGMESPAELSLATVHSGGRFRVTRIAAGGRHRRWFGGGRRRLAELGLVAGAEGQVLRNQGNMMVVLLGGSRMALGHGQSERIMVELMN
jgi:Fur family transcriptional regulator, ferric uptake regulator